MLNSAQQSTHCTVAIERVLPFFLKLALDLRLYKERDEKEVGVFFYGCMWWYTHSLLWAACPLILYTPPTTHEQRSLLDRRMHGFHIGNRATQVFACIWEGYYFVKLRNDACWKLEGKGCVCVRSHALIIV